MAVPTRRERRDRMLADIGAHIERYCRAHGVNLDQLATRAGVSRRCVEAVMQGAQNHRIGTIAAIVWALDCGFVVSFREKVGAGDAVRVGAASADSLEDSRRGSERRRPADARVSLRPTSPRSGALSIGTAAPRLVPSHRKEVSL